MRAPAFWFAVLLLVGPTAGAGDRNHAAASDGEDIVIAARDLAAGAKVTAADLQRVHISKKWATGSQIKADSVSYILDQPLAVPVLKGGVLLWQMFGAPTDSAPGEACARLVRQSKTAVEQVAAARQAVLRR